MSKYYQTVEKPKEGVADIGMNSGETTNCVQRGAVHCRGTSTAIHHSTNSQLWWYKDAQRGTDIILGLVQNFDFIENGKANSEAGNVPVCDMLRPLPLAKDGKLNLSQPAFDSLRNVSKTIASLDPELPDLPSYARWNYTSPRT